MQTPASTSGERPVAEGPVREATGVLQQIGRSGVCDRYRGRSPDTTEGVAARTGFELPAYPTAVGVAHPCIEAWLLADAPAISRALGFTQRANVPESLNRCRPRARTGSRIPKAAVGRCAGQDRPLSSARPPGSSRKSGIWMRFAPAARSVSPRSPKKSSVSSGPSLRQTKAIVRIPDPVKSGGGSGPCPGFEIIPVIGDRVPLRGRRGRPRADVRPGRFGRGGRRGRHQGGRAEVRATRERPGTRRPSRRCSRPTPTSSSRTGRGGKGATSWSAVCSSRRGRPAASGPSPSSRSGCSVPTSRWPTDATRRPAWPAAGIRDVDYDRPEARSGWLADRRDPQHAAGDAGARRQGLI